MVGCEPVKRYERMYAMEHGRVSGRKMIKAEVFSRGPVSCEIDATEGLDAYTGGIYKEFKPSAQTNHIVSIVGWNVDKETEEEYWIVRNRHVSCRQHDGSSRSRQTLPDSPLVFLAPLSRQLGTRVRIARVLPYRHVQTRQRRLQPLHREELWMGERAGVEDDRGHRPSRL